MQSFFGQESRRNKGEPEKIAVASQTIYSHYSKSTNHEVCPNGKVPAVAFKEIK